MARIRCFASISQGRGGSAGGSLQPSTVSSGACLGRSMRQCGHNSSTPRILRLPEASSCPCTCALSPASPTSFTMAAASGELPLPPMPYEYNALEPHLDEATMRVHVSAKPAPSQDTPCHFLHTPCLHCSLAAPGPPRTYMSSWWRANSAPKRLARKVTFAAPRGEAWRPC